MGSERLSIPRREVLIRMAGEHHGSLRSASVSPSVRNGLVAMGLAHERRYGNGLFLELTDAGVEAVRAMEIADAS